MAEAHHAPARDDEPRVVLVVTLPGGLRQVERAAVGLHDEALSTPDEVALDAKDLPVDLRRWNAERAADPAHRPLELGARARSEAIRRATFPAPRRPAPAPARGGARRRPSARRGRRARGAPDRSRDPRSRSPSGHDVVTGMQRSTVDVRPREVPGLVHDDASRSGAALRGHVDLAMARDAHRPKGRRGQMAQHRAGAAARGPQPATSPRRAAPRARARRRHGARAAARPV